MIGLTIHLSFNSDALTSYCVYFSSTTSLMMMGLGLGHLVHAIFHFFLEIQLVVSMEENLASLF